MEYNGCKEVMTLEWAKYRDHDWYDRYCAMCNRPLYEGEKVLVNYDLVPYPVLCEDCVEEIVQMKFDVVRCPKCKRTFGVSPMFGGKPVCPYCSQEVG